MRYLSLKLRSEVTILRKRKAQATAQANASLLPTHSIPQEWRGCYWGKRDPIANEQQEILKK